VRRISWRSGVLAAALLVLLASCGTGVTAGPDEVTVSWCDPGTLLPQSVSSTCAVEVNRELFDPLVALDPETGELELVAAAQIDSEDLLTWTIVLHPGGRFHDGSPLTAASFVDAWNFGANPANGQTRADEFRRIAGFAAVQSGDAETLAGLRAVDEHTIEVVLDAPSATFPSTLVNSPWLPLSPASLADPKRFDDRPIGTGPLRADEDGWVRGQGIRLVRWEGYAGEPATIGAVQFVEYADAGTAYRDFLAGNLDVVTQLAEPDARDARQRFSDRLVEGPGSLLVYLLFPVYHPPYDDVRVRRALAYAVDTEKIITQLLGGVNLPVEGWASPLSGDSRPGACDPCRHDPVAARAFAAEGPPLPEPVSLHYPQIGATQEDFTDAAGVQLRTTLGLEYVLAGARPPDLFERADARRLDGPAFLGYFGDGPAPGLDQFLEALFRSTSFGNTSGYANPELDALLDQAERTADSDARRAVLQRAEDLVFRDVPAVPVAMDVKRVLHAEHVDIGTTSPGALRFRDVRTRS
jgi:oligopeptide transport system substrate-binding protein